MDRHAGGQSGRLLLAGHSASFASMRLFVFFTSSTSVESERRDGNEDYENLYLEFCTPNKFASFFCVYTNTYGTIN